MSPDSVVNQSTGLWRAGWKWLLPLPMIFLLIYTCSQTANLGIGYPVPSVVSSNLIATYAPWERVIVPPISTAIIQDIPELQDNTIDELTQLGEVWITPTAVPVVEISVPTVTQGSVSDYVATSTTVAQLPEPSTPTHTVTILPLLLTSTSTPSATATVTLFWGPTASHTSTPTLSGILTPTPTQIGGITPSPTGTPTPSKTPTLTVPPTPTFTFTPTDIEPPPYTPTFTPTFSPTPTPTRTPTITYTPTITRTPTPTAPPCGGNIPPGEPDIGQPDGNFASLPCGGVLILDLPAMGFSPIDLDEADNDYDLVFYERKVPSQNSDYIELDWVTVEIGAGPSGSCAASTWYMAFNWGDFDMTNNGHLGSAFPELDNQVIELTSLYGSGNLKTGIAIDLNSSALGIPLGWYPCIRIISPFNDPSNDSAEVDAVQILP